MKRALLLIALALGCHFAAVMVAMLYYLWIDAPDFPSIPDNPVYWSAFGALLSITGYWRLRRAR